MLVLPSLPYCAAIARARSSAAFFLQTAVSAGTAGSTGEGPLPGTPSAISSATTRMSTSASRMHQLRRRHHLLVRVGIDLF